MGLPEINLDTKWDDLTRGEQLSVRLSMYKACVKTSPADLVLLVLAVVWLGWSIFGIFWQGLHPWLSVSLWALVLVIAQYRLFVLQGVNDAMYSAVKAARKALSTARYGRWNHAPENKDQDGKQLPDQLLNWLRTPE